MALALPLTAAAEKAALTPEVLLQSVARDVSAHFALEGDLQLSLLRAWAPPAATAEKWTIAVVDYPNAASPASIRSKD